MRIEELVVQGVGPFHEEARFEFPEGNDPNKADVYMFVGPNGSGKSTLLMAMARMLDAPSAGASTGPLDIRLHRHRDAAPPSFRIVLKRSDLVRPVRLQHPHMPLEGMSGQLLWHAGGALEVWGDATSDEWRSMVADSIDRALPIVGRTWRAFAYSDNRRIAATKLDGVGEPTITPGEALSFDASSTDAFVQWVANQDFKAAKAEVRGDALLAAQRRSMVGRLESVLSALTSQNVHFVVDEDPIQVRLTLGGAPLPLHLLPEGVQSMLAWLGDLFMRVDLTIWRDDAPIEERRLILFLDEIAIHSHPAWQRQIVPVLQELLPNAQIFISTHSPFVVASASDAWIYPLKVNAGRATAGKRLESKVGHSYSAVLSDVFGVTQEFDVETEGLLDTFRDLRDRRLRGELLDDELRTLSEKLADRSPELSMIVTMEMRALARKLAAAG